MALNKREKTLAVVTGTLVAIAVAWFTFSTLTGPLTTRRALRDKLRADVQQKSRRVQAALKAEKRLADYCCRALPSDPEIARSLYKNWLLSLTAAAGLEDTRVEPREPRPHRDVYQTLPFSVHARGTGDELTGFLYAFYSKGHLQKIRQLTIKPLEGSRDLDLRIAIEALSMPDADREDELSEEPSARLADASSTDYEVIGDRNLFAAYQPPPPPPPPPTVQQQAPPEVGPPPFDPTKYAFLTGIVEVDGRPHVWLNARTTGEKFTLAEGDTFQIGPMRGAVVQIHPRAAEIEINGKRRLVPLGKSLYDSPEVAN